MLRKSVETFAVFLLVGAFVFGVVACVDGEVGLPLPIGLDSACPAAGCASGGCHGFDKVPEPDGVHEMSCPEVRCASVDCHAWNTLSTRYYQASDASLNLWILAPMALVVCLVLLVRKVK